MNPTPAKCPCEQRTNGVLCRQESIAITVMGKLLCADHTHEYEKKWGMQCNRLHLMAAE